MFLWSEEILEGEICKIFPEHDEDSVLPQSNMYKWIEKFKINFDELKVVVHAWFPS